MARHDPLASVSTRATSQSQPARADQVANSAGGFVFAVDDLTRLRRFLTLGVEGGTYYVAERALTVENAATVLRLAETDPKLVVDEIVAISTAGRAPKQNLALFALAAVAGVADAAGRAYALEHLGQVARTGTHLALFTSYVQQFRGWGRQLRRAIGNWYLDKTPDALAYQVLKYRQRDGWRHRDLLRKAHPKTTDAAKARLFDYIAHRTRDLETGKMPDLDGLPDLVGAFETAQTADTATLVALIGRHPLSWEMLPNEALDQADVWAALLDQGMPITALVRQLPRLTRLGLLSGARGKEVAERLADPAVLRQGRVHPISMLVALRTYASGHGARGQGEWEPVRQIVDALDAGFYAAFRAIEPTGKRWLLALDVSGSMTAQISGLPLSAREASAAMALVTAATEEDYEILGFTAYVLQLRQNSSITRLAISPRQRLDNVLKTISGLPFSRTDCALPMLWAIEHKAKVDVFVVYTDSETWAGKIHPYQALQRYRETMGIPAKLIVVGMTASNFSIADPNDAGMLDVAGFDTAVPNFIADFARHP
jgi:60 kDa SS-A/Ro ribonucleoprotein